MKPNFNNAILFLPDKPDNERDAVASEWKKAGGQVLRLERFWKPPSITDKDIKVYGNEMFCLVLEHLLDIKLVSPTNNFLEKIDYKWTNREITFSNLSNIDCLKYPLFIKPAVPKLFEPRIIKAAEEMDGERAELNDSTLVITSEIVRFDSEVRCFILHGELKSLGIYEGNPKLSEAKSFVDAFLFENKKILPNTVVIDIGYIGDKGWAVIEANATWGAGLNGCDAKNVIDCIYFATKNVE